MRPRPSQHPFYSDLVDIDGRRLLVQGRPLYGGTPLQQSELVKGNLNVTNERLRQGGWAAISGTLAAHWDVGVGDRIALNLPAGRRQLRVAALLTNLGWAPGVITMSDRDFRSAWGNPDPSAIEIDAPPGASIDREAAKIRGALSGYPGLQVETGAARAERMSGEARSSLDRLRQISTMMLIAAALAVAAAMGAAMWQQRPTLAMLKATGLDERRLWRALLVETSLVLAFGGLVGGALGILGQRTLTRWLELSGGYPTDFSPDFGLAAATVLILSGLALALAAIPGYLAARVSPAVQFQD